MKRIPQLDGLRALAVLMVFFYHALHAPLLWAGVDLFFVLSGYLITTILLRLKEDHSPSAYWQAFYSRRLARIVPPYIVLMIAISVMFHVPWHHIWFWYAFFGANIASALGQCTVHAMSPLWSLAVEEQFYFVWPVFVLLCNHKALKKLAIGIMIAAPVLRGIFTFLLSSREPIYDLTPFRADLLACGALIAVCAAEDFQWIEGNRQRSLYVALGAGALLAGFSVFHSFRLNANSFSFNTFGYSLIVLVFGGALVRVLSMRESLGFQFLTFRPMRYLGQVSYTFYLYQVAVMDKLAQHFHSQEAVAVFGFFVTFAISVISWHALEQPILKLRLDPPSPRLRAGTA